MPSRTENLSPKNFLHVADVGTCESPPSKVQGVARNGQKRSSLPRKVPSLARFRRHTAAGSRSVPSDGDLCPAVARDLAGTRSPLRLGGRIPLPEGVFRPRLGPKGPLVNTGRPNSGPFGLQERQNEPADDKIGEDWPLLSHRTRKSSVSELLHGPRRRAATPKRNTSTPIAFFQEKEPRF